MAKKAAVKPTAETQRRRVGKQELDSLRASAPLRLKSSALLDTRVIYCGDNLEQLAKLPDACVDLIYIAQQIKQRKEKLEIDLSKENLWSLSGDRGPSYQQDKKSRLNAMRDYLAVLESWTGLGEPPPRQIEVASRGERLIKRERYKTTDIIGYADIIFTIRVNHLTTTGLAIDNSGNPMIESCSPSWRRYWKDSFKIAFDAKTTIPSFGQTLRDLNTYREFRDWPFVVVSPEARFAEAFADEGFGFIQYPNGVFLRPQTFRET